MEERHQGPTNPYPFGDNKHLDVEFLLEQETTKTLLGFSGYGRFVSTDDDDDHHHLHSLKRSRSFEDKMSFLEMLQSVEPPAAFCELSFQALLSLQHHDPDHHQSQYYYCNQPWDDQILEHLRSPVKTETKLVHNMSSSECNQDQITKPVAVGLEKTRPGEGRIRTESPAETVKVTCREKRKRVKKRTRVVKNKENQRMTHIAVERNRRRQMNDHLTALRSLMPSSYIQRGDQASIIGGAIDFVKELEQSLQSLQAQKRMKKTELLQDRGGGGLGDMTTSSSSSSSPSRQQDRNNVTESELGGGNCVTGRRSSELVAEKKSREVDVTVMMIQNHVNLKVECPRKAGQLLKAIVALEEDLRLTVLHLNITSLHNSLLHYSFNLKIEDDCELGSAYGIAEAVHQVFSFINGTT